MNVLTMQLNSITIMDLIAASLQIRKHKSKATETVAFTLWKFNSAFYCRAGY